MSTVLFTITKEDPHMTVAVSSASFGPREYNFEPPLYFNFCHPYHIVPTVLILGTVHGNTVSILRKLQFFAVFHPENPTDRPGKPFDCDSNHIFHLKHNIARSQNSHAGHKQIIGSVIAPQHKILTLTDRFTGTCVIQRLFVDGNPISDFPENPLFD